MRIVYTIEAGRVKQVRIFGSVQIALLRANERGKRGAFLCSVEIAASRFALLVMTRGAFALLVMTAYSFRYNSNDRYQRGLYTSADI
ncbi:MAG: hypothetical protein LBL66_10885 [Clostridiales bacterium]|nr:hypothetical protein [Clostridiales bacterium]